ncbi:MAG: hypothetical protein HY056_10020 [Proteobacteria bacterium]|nr:hypothetical protein [Pseudomonadota bacterium]
MAIFTNTRAWRVAVLLWGFGALAILGALIGLYGWLGGGAQAAEAGTILTPIMVIVAGGMEFYARRYVIAIERGDGSESVLVTRSLTGTHRAHGRISLGALQRDQGSGGRVSYDNSYRILTLQPSGRKYVIDLTGAPQGARGII